MDFQLLQNQKRSCWEQNKQILRGFSIEFIPVDRLKFKGNQYLFQAMGSIQRPRAQSNDE